MSALSPRAAACEAMAMLLDAKADLIAWKLLAAVVSLTADKGGTTADIPLGELGALAFLDIRKARRALRIAEAAGALEWAPSYGPGLSRVGLPGSGVASRA